ncbi:hypothetical protein I3843_08G004500 [Carya illinoinensis]|nr:uncharacterized protein LOC122319147 [Carya illinoinensis]KAG7965490.1 hypothetical protein I3843_08G004500 [Carya illinoinensis]
MLMLLASLINGDSVSVYFEGKPASMALQFASPPFLSLKMANQHHSSSSRPWLLEAVPLMVVVLIAAHVLALVYWIYRLASEKQPQRRKAH